MNRISKNDYYLGIALAVSKRSTCLKRHYGAVIVKNDEIVATGYNGAARNEQNCWNVRVRTQNITPETTVIARQYTQNRMHCYLYRAIKLLEQFCTLTDMILPWKTESRMNTKWQNVNLAQSVNE